MNDHAKKIIDDVANALVSLNGVLGVSVVGIRGELRIQIETEAIAKTTVLARLKAIREPTPAQTDAGDDCDSPGAEYSGYANVPASADAHYRAMIDALIKEMEA